MHAATTKGEGNAADERFSAACQNTPKGAIMLAPENIRWHRTVDIAVIGYGLAGAVAAIAAREKGASIMILEKQEAAVHRTSSSMSAGFFLCPSDVNGAKEYMKALCRMDDRIHWTDEDTINAWAEYGAQNIGWLKNLGASILFYRKTAEHPQLPGADSIEVWRFNGFGLGMMNFMYRQVQSRTIEVLYQTAAQRLLTDEAGRVIGLVAERTAGGRPEKVYIRAHKAVILCTGGFEENDEMILQYLKMYPVYFTGGTANTGDGIKMAQEVGADLWHMNCVSARLVAKFPDFPIAFTLAISGYLPGPEQEASGGFIIVDKYGRRYMSENIKSHTAFYELTSFDTHKLEYPRVPSYFIFDRRRMEKGPLVSRQSGAAGPQQLYRWSLDNTEELRKGWITGNETVPGLADQLGLSASLLEQTVQIWNRYCREGQDPEFSRKISDLVPLDAPPYYAIKLFPGGPNTQGGPRHNSRAQVLNPFGSPIQGLYAAGECGSVYGMFYPAGGGNLAECMAFGRIAVENALRE